MVINFYGGDGCGKSSIASMVFSELRKRNYKADLPREVIKDWAYLKRSPEGTDQFLIFAQQLSATELPLRCGIDHIVSDSPLYMQCAYAYFYDNVYKEEMITTTNKFHERYPGTIDFFLDRNEIPYEQIGRYRDLEGAKNIDKYMYDFLTSAANINLIVVSPKDVDKIMEEILRKI